jgi:hypothetical protein
MFGNPKKEQEFACRETGKSFLEQTKKAYRIIIFGSKNAVLNKNRR